MKYYATSADFHVFDVNRNGTRTVAWVRVLSPVSGPADQCFINQSIRIPRSRYTLSSSLVGIHQIVNSNFNDQLFSFSKTESNHICTHHLDVSKLHLEK